MRRKSERNKSKSSPESKPEKPKRGRPSRKKKSPSSSPDRDSTSEECLPARPDDVEVPDVSQSQVACQSEIVTPEKVQSHSDEDNLEVWHVKATETSDTGEIQKLKICLSRPSMTPERPDRSPRGRKKLNRSTSQSECQAEAAEEKRKGRHRSRRSSAKDTESTDVPNSDDNVESSITSDTDIKEKSSETVTPGDVDSVKVHASKPNREVSEITSAEKGDEASLGNTSVIDKSDENSMKVCDNAVLQVSAVTSVNLIESESSIEKSDEEKSKEPISKQIEKNVEVKETVETRKEIPVPITVAPTTNENKESTMIDEQIEIEKCSKDSLANDANVDKSSPVGDSNIKSVQETEKPSPNVDENNPENGHQCKRDAVNEMMDSVNITTDVASEKGVEENKDEDMKCQKEHVNELVKEAAIIHNSRETKESEISDKNPPTSYDSKETKLTHGDEEVKHKATCDDNIKLDLVSDQIFEPSVQDAQAARSAGNMRKRRWGSRSSKVSKSTIVNISTDSLKNLISNVELVSADEVLMEVVVKESAEIEPPKKVLTECQNKTNGKYNVQDEAVDKEFLGSMSHRKISIVNEEAPKLHRTPSPPKYKSSSILYITNLVRPFTLPQLKNLLQRTGRIVENGFWIDKIKSKCYVQYETEDEAIETRHALHGVTWPVSNPKVLNVDFGSKSAMQEALASGEEEKPVGHVDNWVKEQHTRDSKSGLMDIEQKGSDKRTVVREWDLGKGDIKEDKTTERQVNRHREGVDIERRKRRTKSRSPSPARKFKKKEEEAPSKLLDDLFKKTKTTPCIYWLPLNAETILVKEEQRRKHMAEHERRMEELRRAAEEIKGGRHNVSSHHAPTHRHR